MFERRGTGERATRYAWGALAVAEVDERRRDPLISRRRHRGLAEILAEHRVAIGNPRYGRIGLVALPYYLVFEFLAPPIGLAGPVLVPLGLMAGAVDLGFAWRFLLVAYGYAMLIVENVGYRQLTAFWRVQGTWSALTGAKHVWGEMTRTGFVGRRS